MIARTDMLANPKFASFLSVDHPVFADKAKSKNTTKLLQEQIKNFGTVGCEGFWEWWVFRAIYVIRVVRVIKVVRVVRVSKLLVVDGIIRVIEAIELILVV